MGVQFITVKCPECGATLNIEENRHQAFCSYCGSKVLINNDNEYIYRTIDEAKIKETELKETLKLKEIENHEKKVEGLRRTRFARIIASIILAIISVVFVFLKDVDPFFGIFCMIPLLVIMCLWIPEMELLEK